MSHNLRNKCQLKIEEDNYRRHLTRLERLKDGKSPDQLRRDHESKKISGVISAMRKMHTYNRKYKSKENNENKRRTNYTNFNRVKSVVKNEFGKPPLPMAPRHKATLQPINEENERIFNRIYNVKPRLNFKSIDSTQKATKILPNISAADFSHMYKTSRMNETKKTQFVLSVGRGKKDIKILIEITAEQILHIFKDHNSLYAFEVECNEFKTRGELFILGELEDSCLVIKIAGKLYNQQSIWVRLVKILDHRDLTKGQFIFSKKELASITASTHTSSSVHNQLILQKEVLGAKGKSEGDIWLHFRVKKSRKSMVKEIMVARKSE